MKSILLSLLVLFLITSCAHNKIRFVKQTRQKVVKVDQPESSSSDLKEAQAFREILLPENSSQEVLVENTPEDKFEDEILSSFDGNTPAPTDTTKQEIIDAKPLNKETEARIAQDDAELANKLMLGSLWSLLAIPLGGLGLIASATLFIIGRIKFNKANKSRYITEDGKEFLKKARKKQIALTVIWALLVALAVALFVEILTY